MKLRPWRRSTVAITTVTAVSIILAGCGSSKSSDSSSTSSAASKDVVIAYNAVDNMDPIQFKTNSDYMITNNVYGTLVSGNYKTQSNGIMVGDGTYTPSLASSLTWNSAGTLLTIVLKPNLKFSDGSALTADDAVYTLQRSLSKASYANGFLQYMGMKDATTDVKVVDPTTLTIATAFKPTLMEKFLSFPLFGIVEKSAGEAHKTAADPWAQAFFAKTVISSGPYKVQSWPDQNSMVLEKNAAYTVSDISKSPNTVTVRNISDSNQEYLAMQQGQVDIAMGLAPKLAKKAQGDAGLKVTTSAASDLVYLGFNNADPALKNVKVRQALSYLVPYATLRNDVYAGFANSAYGVAPYPMDSALDTAGTKDAYPTNATQAKTLLSEAGVSNLTLTLSVDAGDPTAIQTATFIQSAFAEGGVTVKINQMQSADYNDKLGKHQLQTFLGEWYSWGQDPIYQMYFLLNSGSFVNYTGYKNATFDSTIAKAVSESDPAARNKLSQQLQQMAIDDAPMAYLYTRDYIVVTNKNVSGVTQPDDEFPYFQYLDVQ